MNNDIIYDAFSGVREEYLSAADNADAIRHSFKRNRARKTKIIGSVVCCAALVLAAGWIGSQNWFQKTPAVLPGNTTIANQPVSEQPSSQPTEAQPGIIPQETVATTDSDNRQQTTVEERPSPPEKETEPTASTPKNNDEPAPANDHPVLQTEDETQNAQNGSGVPNGGGNMYFMKVSSLEWNGIVYHDTDMPRVGAYTQDQYLGKAKDFNCNSNGEYNYRVSPDDSVYTVKETNDILFVVKANGRIVVMANMNWSLEKYEPERLDPNWVDPNYSPDNPPEVWN